MHDRLNAAGGPRTGPVQFVFVGSIFLSAFLLFLVQPLVTKLLLPSFGGSPAVWNTGLVFFQALLLVGYLYAHLLSRLTHGRSQLVVHGIILLLPLILLPPELPSGLDPSQTRWPAGALLAGLAVMVGGPFLVLSTNSSLIQHWWSRSGFAGGEDPYWLYGASNVGSLLALLAYPFAVEPLFDLEKQTTLWSWGYGLFALLSLSAMAWAAARDSGGVRVETDAGPGVANARRFLWVARAAVGSSLLLSVTMRITTDVASVPLFWVVPLAIYLITFILAFGFTERLRRDVLVPLTLIALAASLGLLITPLRFSLMTVTAASLATLFLGALLCHRDLAADRPAARHLTEFYLWIAVGGAVGGILNSIVAPLLFDSVAEFPLTMLALLLLVYADPQRANAWRTWVPRKPIAILFAVALVLPVVFPTGAETDLGLASMAAVSAGTVLAGVGMARYAGLTAILTGCVVAAYLGGVAEPASTIAQERSFFGVLRVQRLEDGVQMVHGTTVHGGQSLDGPLRGKPSGYYHDEGPLGAAMRSQAPNARIGVVGLGAGALTSFVQPGQQIVFHEIDPLVVGMAGEYFTYLDDAGERARVVLGDGRLSLEALPDATYDLLILDAFSSDFVPTHLLTVEALTMYLDKVRPGGLVLLHISNRYVDLNRVVKGFAQTTGTPAAYAHHSPSDSARAEGGATTQVAALARNPARLDRLMSEAPFWNPIPESVEPVVWTDHRADLLSVLR